MSEDTCLRQTEMLRVFNLVELEEPDHLVANA
jgi:hypothetical protein